MHITQISSREEWEAYMDVHAVTTFMQSWSWGEFEQSCGHEVGRLMVWDDTSRAVAALQYVILRSRRGTLLYVPHGPILRQDILPWSVWTTGISPDIQILSPILDVICQKLQEIARSSSCHFIRLNSSLPKHQSLTDYFSSQGYIAAPIYLTSENAAVLSLELPDGASLLDSMRKTTRYLIKKAVKEGVTIDISRDRSAVERFMKLYRVTTAREKFVGFGERYIRSEFEAFERYEDALILHARHGAQDLASALIIFTNNSAFYHQGASNHPKVPAPYLLQYRAMELARHRGCKYYNLWGTYIPHRTPRGWQGLTLFKTGFTKLIWSYLPTMDLPISPLYHLTRMYEQFIRFSRGV